MGFLSVCVAFNYVHILRGSFLHVSGVCSVFFYDVMNDGGKVFVYMVLRSVRGTMSSTYYTVVVPLLRFCVDLALLSHPHICINFETAYNTSGLFYN
jgi:hypothetical protein